MVFVHFVVTFLKELTDFNIDSPGVDDSQVFELGEDNVIISIIEFIECLKSKYFLELATLTIDLIYYFCKLFFFKNLF